MIDLMLPRLGAPSIAVGKDDSALGSLRLDVHYTERDVRKTADWDVDSVQVEIKLDCLAN
jgi:hypothetical protein